MSDWKQWECPECGSHEYACISSAERQCTHCRACFTLNGERTARQDSTKHIEECFEALPVGLREKIMILINSGITSPEMTRDMMSNV